MAMPVTVDFETIGIEKRPHYPPSPVSVSIKEPGKKPRFYAWGHINGGNNCTYGEAREALQKVWDSKSDLLFHNAKFDLAVAHERLGLEIPHWKRVHDTLFLTYLDDPRQKTFSLKPTAQRLLGQAPDERDAVEEWLVANQPIPGVRLKKGGGGKNPPGKYIAYAPGDVVGAYANGDVSRTEDLFKHLMPSIKERGMSDAYDRERRVLIALLDIEQRGVQVDYQRLSRDCERYSEVKDQVTAWIAKRLGKSKDPDFNPGSDSQLLEVLIGKGLVDEGSLLMTDKGNRSASKESLQGAMKDKVLYHMLAYMSELSTCLNTFMLNYLYTASQSPDHRIYTSWNQVRQDRQSGGGGGMMGTSTGRLSSVPNFQNISNEFEPHFIHLCLREHYDSDDEWKKALAGCVRCPLDLPPLPLVRSYIIPFEGHVLIDRDYSQQELRILAHFEYGSLLAAYLANPWLDVHDWARDEINAMLNASFTRRPIKDMGFGLIYGMGVGKLAVKSGTDVNTSKQLKKAYLTIAPGLKELYDDMRYRADNNLPIRTWGGREYYCEEPAFVDGRLRKFDYKMLNLLIQGSAADCTKEALVRYYDAKPHDHHLILNVHDQLTASVPKKDLVSGMECLRSTMESIEFDVPMLTEGTWSADNWDKSSLKTYDKKGKLHYAG